MEEQAIKDTLPGEPKSAFRYFPFFNQKQPVFVLVLLGLVFYCTSLYNEYALDDGIVIHQNNYVLKGVAGIKDIMTKDLYDAFYRRMNAKDQLQGGRYHPLPIVSFAIEQEIIGSYRTGFYQFVEDLNENGKLDEGPVEIATNKAVSTHKENGTNVNLTIDSKKKDLEKTTQQPLNVYEYNKFVDANGDGAAQVEECNNCWDLNKNFRNDASEDLNADGVYNEIDCQVYGAKIRHFNNILLYILACVLLYVVLRRHVFKDNQDMAFLAALIFLIHPVHSEVIANIKGRDEIFSAIFMSLTFLFSFKFMANKKSGTLFFASIMFFLALLSKEYAIVLLLLIPLALYVFNKIKIDTFPLMLLIASFAAVIIFMIFLKLELASSLPPLVIVFAGFILFSIICLLLFRKTFVHRELNALMIGLFSFSLLYIGMRLNAVSITAGVADTELLNDPYLLADGEQKFATKIFILLKYLVLSLFPKNLSSDYSYDTIAYRHFTDFSFILAFVLNLGLLVTGIVLVLRRHVLGFAVVTYFAFLLLVTNFIFSIGATMHEGFLFHASIGIAICLSWLIITGIEKIDTLTFATRRNMLLGSVIIATFLCGCKTWERNWDWKNDVTLFLKDVKTSPNSVLILGNAGARWIDLADTKEITGINIPGEDSTRYNDYNGTLKITDEELAESGYKNKREVALRKGMAYLERAVALHPRYVNGYLNLGLASFKLDNDRDAIYYWKIAENLYPDNPYLSNYYRVYANILAERGYQAFSENRMKDAAIAYNLRTIVRPLDAEAWYDLGGVFFNARQFYKAETAWKKALNLDPGYEDAKKAMQMLPPK